MRYMIVGFDDLDIPVEVSRDLTEAGVVLDTPLLLEDWEEANIILTIEESSTHDIRWDIVEVDETITEDISYYMDAI